MPEPTTDALLRRVDRWSHAHVELDDGRATVHGGPDDTLVAVVDRRTGSLTACGSADAVDLNASAGPARAEALLRWRLDLEVFGAQARVASP